MRKPLLIGIGGTCSNSGKTTIAVLLLQYLAKDSCGQPIIGKSFEAADPAAAEVTAPECVGTGKWGAIKYTKTELYASLVEDNSILSLKEKDTGRFLDAGAEDAIWVKSPPQALEEVLPLAMERLYYLDGLIIEGNSAIEFLKPDIVIFTFGGDKARWKTGIERLAGHSDIIVYENESELPEIVKTKRLFQRDSHGIHEVQEFFAVISGLIHERKTERRNNKKGC